MLLRFLGQLLYHFFRHKILTTTRFNEKLTYLAPDRTLGVKKIMALFVSIFRLLRGEAHPSHHKYRTLLIIPCDKFFLGPFVFIKVCLLFLFIALFFKGFSHINK
jgi:hypothetical protein